MTKTVLVVKLVLRLKNMFLVLVFNSVILFSVCRWSFTLGVVNSKLIGMAKVCKDLLTFYLMSIKCTAFFIILSILLCSVFFAVNGWRRRRLSRFEQPGLCSGLEVWVLFRPLDIIKFRRWNIRRLTCFEFTGHSPVRCWRCQSYDAHVYIYRPTELSFLFHRRHSDIHCRHGVCMAMKYKLHNDAVWSVRFIIIVSAFNQLPSCQRVWPQLSQIPTNHVQSCLDRIIRP